MGCNKTDVMLILKDDPTHAFLSWCIWILAIRKWIRPQFNHPAQLSLKPRQKLMSISHVLLRRFAVCSVRSHDRCCKTLGYSPLHHDNRYIPSSFRATSAPLSAHSQQASIEREMDGASRAKFSESLKGSYGVVSNINIYLEIYERWRTARLNTQCSTSLTLIMTRHRK